MKFRNLLIGVLLALNTSIAFAQPSGETISNTCGLAQPCGALVADLTDGAYPVTGTTVTATGTGGFVASASGGTLSLQEATAGTKCMGSVTGTGTSAVTVATTCAAANSRVFIARSSAPSGTAQCWTTNIVAATSFDFDCDGAETGTFHWFIVKESS